MLLAAFVIALLTSSLTAFPLEWELRLLDRLVGPESALALIFGPIRGIPLFWRLIDCSFGLFGAIPLWLARGTIRQVTDIQNQGSRGTG